MFIEQDQAYSVEYWEVVEVFKILNNYVKGVWYFNKI